MKAIEVGLIVADLENDTLEGQQYPAILMSILCDALSIRGAVGSHQSLSTTFKFSGTYQVHECRDADIVCLTAETYCYGLTRRKRSHIIYCPLLDHFFRWTMANSRQLTQSNVILGKDYKGICVQWSLNKFRLLFYQINKQVNYNFIYLTFQNCQCSQDSHYRRQHAWHSYLTSQGIL